MIQIKPLTEEEKKQRLEELRQRAVEKKATKAVQEAEENKANEKIRRRAGQVWKWLGIPFNEKRF